MRGGGTVSEDPHVIRIRVAGPLVIVDFNGQTLGNSSVAKTAAPCADRSGCIALKDERHPVASVRTSADPKDKPRGERGVRSHRNGRAQKCRTNLIREIGGEPEDVSIHRRLAIESERRGAAEVDEVLVYRRGLDGPAQSLGVGGVSIGDRHGHREVSGSGRSAGDVSGESVDPQTGGKTGGGPTEHRTGGTGSGHLEGNRLSYRARLIALCDDQYRAGRIDLQDLRDGIDPSCIQTEQHPVARSHDVGAGTGGQLVGARRRFDKRKREIAKVCIH